MTSALPPPGTLYDMRSPIIFGYNKQSRAKEGCKEKYNPLIWALLPQTGGYRQYGWNATKLVKHLLQGGKVVHDCIPAITSAIKTSPVWLMA